jgi:hypothetical protein
VSNSLLCTSDEMLISRKAPSDTTEIASDAISVSEVDLKSIGNSISRLHTAHDNESIERYSKHIIDAIHRITGNGEPYSQSAAVKYKSMRDAGELVRLEWDGLEQYYVSLYVFFNADSDFDDEPYTEDEYGNKHEDENDVIRQSISMQRWNEEENEAKHEGRITYLNRRVLNGLLGRVKKRDLGQRSKGEGSK